MQIHLKVWRQQNRASQGHFADYTLTDASPDMSFLEMLDLLNDRLIRQGERPIEFDHDCREGICGQCGVMINGRAHGPLPNTTTCQLHMRTFTDGDTIHVENEVVAIAPSRTRVDRGIVTVSSQTLNQDGAAVQTTTMKLVMFRK